MLISLYGSLSYGGIPFNSFEDAVQKDAFRWEDGINHDIPQDLADMTGWTQIAKKVVDEYLSLDLHERKNCQRYQNEYCRNAYKSNDKVIFRLKRVCPTCFLIFSFRVISETETERL